MKFGAIFDPSWVSEYPSELSAVEEGAKYEVRGGDLIELYASVGMTLEALAPCTVEELEIYEEAKEQEGFEDERRFKVRLIAVE